MANVYLLLGSNEGEREENIQNACRLIELRCGSIIKRSALYETEAWGLKEQHSFLNQAVQITTTLTPVALLTLLKTIEKEMGRVETVKWGPRIIDIDILLYGNEIIELPELSIPHPFMQDRRFTLVPLNELAPLLVHPVLKKSIVKLLKACTDESKVVLYVTDK